MMWLTKSVLAALVVASIGVLFSVAQLRAQGFRHWSDARWDSAGLAPAPADHPEALVQVYAARAWGWRGAVAVHSWIVLKPEGATAYDRYDVMGWGVGRGAQAVRKNARPPDGRWAGAEPMLLAELRGDGARDAIAKIEQAIRDYPYKDVYRTWPGPNSNTFVATVARAAPELKLDLPATAIGKDYLPNGALLAPTLAGDGVQLSLFGLAGFTLGLEDGVEVNLLGLSFAVDPLDLAIDAPGVGRIGWR